MCYRQYNRVADSINILPFVLPMQKRTRIRMWQFAKNHYIY